MLQNNPDLQSAIKRLWDKFWSGGISNPLTAIEQNHLSAVHETTGRVGSETAGRC
nr:hypothetical protein PJ912_12555 [Pectobacterium colocasium]